MTALRALEGCLILNELVLIAYLASCSWRTVDRQPHNQDGQQRTNPAQGNDHLSFAHHNFLSARSNAVLPPTISPAVSFPDPGPCGFIDFDDEREFDFSLIPARPRLRLVISNSIPVKA